MQPDSSASPASARLAALRLARGVDIPVDRRHAELAALAAAMRDHRASAEAMARARLPVEHLRLDLARDHAERRRAFEQALTRWEQIEWALRGPRPRRPSYRALIVSDVTMEALVAALATSRGLALVRDELVGWIASM